MSNRQGPTGGRGVVGLILSSDRPRGAEDNLPPFLAPHVSQTGSQLAICSGLDCTVALPVAFTLGKILDFLWQEAIEGYHRQSLFFG